MSASFKLAAKKKMSQQELRLLMQQQKQSRNKSETTNSKIDSPFAKYDNGQLNCQLCKSTVRSEAVWKVHVNSKQHKENLTLAKQLKEKLENQNKPPVVAEMEQRLAALRQEREKSLRVEFDAPEGKKLKGILKNGTSSIVKAEEPSAETSNHTSTSTIPDDFFDTKRKPATSEKHPTQEDKTPADEALPEGFFDDPMKDAKVKVLETFQKFILEIRFFTGS